MDCQEEYRRKLISPEQAAALVQSGNTVLFTVGREARTVGYALGARLGEVHNVRVLIPTPGFDFPWYDEGWQDAFEVAVGLPTDACQEALDARRVDFFFGDLIPFRTLGDWDEADVVLTEVSPPNERGFCSFGASLWNKKQCVRQGKLSIAEVNPRLIRTYGDNYIHVSEIDYFVEHVSQGREPGQGSLAGRTAREPEPHLKDIARYVGSLINSGDTIQIGVGRTTEPLVRLGLLDGKQDIGYHSEATPRGTIALVQEGVINGKRKTIHKEQVVVTTIGGGSREEMDYVHENPRFYLMDMNYVEDVRIIAAHDNFVAINNALAVDVTGQIASETLGYKQYGTAGGQVPFAIGALLSRNGRSVSVLPSTARGGEVSRITPAVDAGTVVTIPRSCADYVVTEYGIAHLRGRTLRQRVEALINVAHPHHRQELWKEARRLYWP